METNLKKLLSIFGVVCFSIASLSAGPCCPTEKQSNNCCDVNTREKMMPPSRTAVPPGKYQQGEDSPCVLISADYTLWTARQGGLAYAITGLNFDGSENCCGTVCYPKWKLRSGFKVDLGMYLDHDGWDVVAQYTWFYNQNNRFDSCCFDAGTGMATWGLPLQIGELEQTNCAQIFLPSQLTAACAKWDNWFNRIDLQMGRTFYAGHYHTLRAFLGLLGAWDQQDFDINYLPTCFFDGSTNYLLRNRQTWWGIGPWAGVCPAYIFPQGCSDTQWSIFLDSGIALPWCKADATHRMFTQASVASTSTSGCNDCNDCGSCNDCCDDGGCDCIEVNCDDPRIACYENVFWNVMPVLDLALGLRWETWFECNWNFLLQAAWEQQVYFDHNHMFALGDNPRGSGNYTMQGLTIKAAIGF